MATLRPNRAILVLAATIVAITLPRVFLPLLPLEPPSPEPSSDSHTVRKNHTMLRSSSNESAITVSSGIGSGSGSSSRAPAAAVDCIKVRGEYGEWVKDLDYAAKVQYTPKHGFRQRMWKRKHEHMFTKKDFLPQTTYAWRETKYPQCQMQVMSKEGFCSVIQKLNIKNVYMAGDSMMQAMWVSFMGILGLNEEANEGDDMTCPGNFTFRLIFDRTILASIPPPPINSTINTDRWGYDAIKVVPEYGQLDIGYCPSVLRAERGGGRKAKHPKVANNGACPWVQEYESLQGRTLLIMNTGAAYHATKTFNRMFDSMVDALDKNTTKRNDIAFFRSTSAAHHDCFNSSRYVKSSFTDFEDYVARGETTRYSWNLFRWYNDYARRRLEDREGRTDVFPLRFLNIFNMTALRPDGHVAANDCLHYELPSVVDWWNHLLFSNLLDIAEQEAKAEE